MSYPKALFAYGTLQPGKPNAHILEGIEGTWTPATISGHLKECGWGSAMGYPGVIFDDDGEEVPGHLFRSEQLGEHLERLDEFEGNGYERVVSEVTLRGGEQVAAFVYVLREAGLGTK